MEKYSFQNADPSGITLRIKSLLLDWLFICGYLLIIFVVFMAYYLLVIGEIPLFTNVQSQLLATFSTIVPIIIIFSIMEGSKAQASWGKRKVHLKVMYKGNPLKSSFIRNSLKFLPWQFGHMSTINGIYNGFENPFSMVFFILSVLLPCIYIMMAFSRKDNRHLADLLAGSKVIKR